MADVESGNGQRVRRITQHMGCISNITKELQDGSQAKLVGALAVELWACIRCLIRRDHAERLASSDPWTLYHRPKMIASDIRVKATNPKYILRFRWCAWVIPKPNHPLPHPVFDGLHMNRRQLTLPSANLSFAS